MRTLGEQWRRLSSFLRRGGAARPYLLNKGYCVICDGETTFSASDSWLRDHYLCPRCGSIPRHRALMWCVELFYPGWKELAIHESSPRPGAVSRLASQGKHYLATQYYPDVPLGALHPSGYRCEDLERQTFPDESFDLVITQDVLEHVLDPALAFQEIARTLRKGGAHILTTPLLNKAKPSQVRARKDGSGAVVHLLPPEYHENPLGPNGFLVTVHWGYDIAEYILKHSGLFTTMVHIDDLSKGIRAEYNEVLVSRKL